MFPSLLLEPPASFVPELRVPWQHPEKVLLGADDPEPRTRVTALAVARGLVMA